LLLVLLFVAYTTSIDRDVVRWVRAIETSARRRGADGYDRVAVTDDMPQDLQRVALAYNSLVDDAEARQNQLQAALATNGGLLRELNHHIKNSLQVLQSYLAISRRFSSREPDPALLEIEAKVLVLSSVYRRALREGSMQPVELAAFIEELVAWLNRNLAGSGHNISACMKEVAFPLNVDRTIPLGLAIVEAVAAAVRLPDMTRTDVCIASIDSDSVDIKVTCNGDHAALDLPARILSGLARQLQADDVRQTTDAILHWRFRFS
jgi:hypothetical protein